MKGGLHQMKGNIHMHIHESLDHYIYHHSPGYCKITNQLNITNNKTKN